MADTGRTEAATGTAGRARALRLLASATAGLTFILMMLGGYVKAIHAGLACPDWPTCWGAWLPPFENAHGFTSHQIMAEWTHRLVASVTGLAFLATFFAVWRFQPAHRLLRVLPWAALVTLAVQVLLGGLTVTRGLEPLIVVAHLGMATVFFGMVLLVAYLSWVAPLAAPDGAPGAETAPSGRAEAAE